MTDTAGPASDVASDSARVDLQSPDAPARIASRLDAVLKRHVARLIGDDSRQADGVLTPDHVLDMQRTVGNRATTRFLGRATLARQQRTTTTNDPNAADPKGPPGFGFDGFSPEISGTVVVSPVDDATVDITGPKLTVKAKVWKLDKSGPMPGGSGYVGFVQNLVSSDRGKVYRAGGEPAGEIVAEVHGNVGKAWDAYKDRKNPDKPFTYHKPFYNEAKPISDTNIAGGMEAHTDMYDEPGFHAPKKLNQDGKIGFLTEVVGQDRFKLALAVELADKNMIYLQGIEWTLPWKTSIGKDARGTGGTILHKDIPLQSLAAEGPDPNLVNWSLDEKEEVWQAFSTPEMAMSQSAAVLLAWLPRSRGKDAVSEKNILAALAAKQPKATARITCTDEADEIRGDYASASIKGKVLGKSLGGIHIAESEHAELTATIIDLFGDYATFPANAPITVEISVGAEGATGSETWLVPWGGEKTIKAGGAAYDVRISLS